MGANSANSEVFSFETDSEVYTAVFPRGTMLKAKIQEDVSSEINQTGNPVSFVVNYDLSVGQMTCIPKGSYMYGKIISIERARQGRDGFFQIIIDKLIFPDGWRTPMTGKIWTADGTGIIGGKLTQMQEFKKIPHYIENLGGGVVQLVRTGPRAMGNETVLPAGKELIIVLEQDLRVKYLESLE